MAEVHNRVQQNTGVVDADDEDGLTVVNGETVEPGTYPKTRGGMPSGSPPAAPPQVNETDVDRVADAIGRTGGDTNHPDGPGVGGD